MEASSSTPARSTKRSKPPEPEGVTLDFELDKETKGAARFAEVPAKGQEAYVRTLYMRKELWEQLDKAELMEVTIKPVSD